MRTLASASGFEHVDRAVAAGRRMIVFSGHIANWEIAMLAGVQYGVPIAQIYRAGNNPLLDRMIARFRGDGGEWHCQLKRGWYPPAVGGAAVRCREVLGTPIGLPPLSRERAKKVDSTELS